MITRTLAIARAAILESLRSRVAPLVALVLVLTVPAISLLFGEAPNQGWLTRNSVAEGLRIVLPLIAVLVGAFALKPTILKGWSLLPARRAEQFLGTALAGCCTLTGGALLFALGGVIASLAFDEPLVETVHAERVSVRSLDGEEDLRAQQDDAFAWANPKYGEALFFEIPAQQQEVRGTVEYQRVYWYTDAPPSTRQPVEVFVRDSAGLRKAEVRVQSRRRVEFSAPVEGDDAAVLVTSNDPAFVIGARPDMLYLETDRSSPIGSVLALLALALGAALMSFLFVLAVRSRATPATAALAGLLLITSLTLLPSLAPAQQMARDRRADMTGGKKTTSLLKQFEEELESLPQLVPEFAFEEFLSGRTVPGQAWLQGLTRLGVGVLFVLPGALLYTRRQISK